MFPCKEDNPAYQKNSKGARLKQKGYRMEDVIKRLKTAGEGGSGVEPVVTNADSVLNHQRVWVCAGLLVELHQSRDKSEIFVYISAT